MANRRFTQFHYALERKVVEIYLKATIGAAGAVTMVTSGSNSQGVTSIVKQATGQYLITLQDKYTKLLNVHVMTMNATGTGNDNWALMSGGTNTYPSGLGGAEIQILHSDTAMGTDPSNGDTLFFTLTMGDSSV